MDKINIQKIRFIMTTKCEPANDDMNAKDCDYYHDSSCNIYQVGHMIIPIVQRRKLRLTEVEDLV